MSILANAFLETFHVDGVLCEWLHHIRAKADASAFAAFILECMRDPDDHERRLRFTSFAMFIKSRTWPKVAEAIGPKIPPDDRDLLKDPFAEKFYDEMKAFVTLAILDYQRQFVAQTKDLLPVEVPKEFGGSDVITKDEIVRMIDEAMEQSMKKALENIRREIEGEDWKSGTDQG